VRLSEVIAHADYVYPGTVVEVVFRGVAVLEEELVLGTAQDIGRWQYIVLQSELESGETAVLHTVTVDRPEAGAQERTGVAAAEVAVLVAAGAAVPEIVVQVLALDVGEVDALADTPDAVAGGVPAVFAGYAEAAVVEVLVAGARAGEGELPAAVLGPDGQLVAGDASIFRDRCGTAQARSQHCHRNV
jgi:hypothetical protein